MTTFDSPKNFKNFGKELREARESQGHNLAILAAQCDLSVVLLTAIEKGDISLFTRSQLNLPQAIRLYAKALNIDITHNKQIVSLVEDDIYIPEFLKKK
ncbi:hypothetical protein DP176_07070 [Polynucleobacter paneuropaeus]|uniref:HTH cro/C1-type domain-containing protein n=1 Tax=Polynucleobacter paneuropaeus TaxID=2527775 RepID=A0ABX9FDI1_9BURK|nr:helix-turn-helix domain-containing protein [Polynucleobacter paneuropaeus]RAZ42302.1 hypothetical protein DP176_07070 [Polynucleobacter paneuropaeus]